MKQNYGAPYVYLCWYTHLCEHTHIYAYEFRKRSGSLSKSSIFIFFKEPDFSFIGDIILYGIFSFTFKSFQLLRKKMLPHVKYKNKILPVRPQIDACSGVCMVLGQAVVFGRVQGSLGFPLDVLHCLNYFFQGICSWNA